MKLTWFGHSCIRLKTGASTLLIDPFLKGNPTFEKSGIPWSEATKGVTHVALTHGHSDHIGDSAEICAKTKAPLFANYELALYLKGKGAENIEPMNTGGTVSAADFDVTLVHALHSSSADVYLGNPGGLIIKPKVGPVFYHMGDTEMHAEMGLIAEYHNPAIICVPIGDRFTMGPKSAAFACKKFFPGANRTFIPVHYGTFPGMLEADATRFQAEMAGHKVIVPKIGEPVTF
jgi:L-ascorbate metabolism protein UlaG (beta-lactamase superfamily)